MFQISEQNGFKSLVYANEDSIEPNRVVYKLKGKILSQPTRTSIQIGKNLHIEDPWGQYINHSCDPNVQVVNNKLISLKPIQKGDTITFDYNQSEDLMATPFKCFCCGKIIGGKYYMDFL